MTFVKIANGNWILVRGNSKKGQSTYVIYKGRSFKGTFPSELEGKRVRVVLEVIDNE